jgi:hypothetical protein
VTAMPAELVPAPRRRRPRRRPHRRVLAHLAEQGVPFLVGGGYALRHYTGDVRGTRDLDLFVRRRDARRLLGTLAALGLETDLTFPHWLGKARLGSESIDVIYSSGNGVAAVDEDWFRNAVPATVLGVRVDLSPPEEMIWSKAFVMERERFDGADIAHLLLACQKRLDWHRLVRRFGPHWRVLFAHLVLFGFVYPSERAAVPASVMRLLGRRLACERREPPPEERVCRGTLLSRAQYLTDVFRRGYADARLGPDGGMTPEDVALWTAAIESEEKNRNAPGRDR